MLVASVGVSFTRTWRLTAAGAELDVLLDGDGLGDDVELALALPDALLLGVGSPVGPGDDVDDGRPTVGVAVTSTIRGVGAPCTGAAPGLEDPAGLVDELLADGDGVTGAIVTVTTGPGEDASGIATPCAMAASSAATPPAPIMYQVAMNGGGHMRFSGARGSRTTRRPARRAP